MGFADKTVPNRGATAMPVARGRPVSRPQPIAEGVRGTVVVRYRSLEIARSSTALRVPRGGEMIYFFSPFDVRMDLLAPADTISLHEDHGAAVDYDLVVAREVLPAAAWSHPLPPARLADLGGLIAFSATEKLSISVAQPGVEQR